MSDAASDSLSPNLPPDVARRMRRRQEDMEEELAKEGEGGEETVQVCIRVRPFNRREMDIQAKSGEGDIRSVVEMPDGMGGKVRCLHRNDDGEYELVEEFQYTKSFWSILEDQQPHAFAPVTQEDVFDSIGRSMLKYAFVGFNNCVFAYGQTGSGKTHTMMGDFQTEGGEFTGDPGIIPRLCKELFERIERKKEARQDDIKRTFDVKLSAIEIYNEQVRDLFWRNTPGRSKGQVLKVRMHPTDGAFVDQLSVLNPSNWEKCIKLIADGVAERTVAATLMNAESSRSHSVFQITLTQTETIHIRNPDDPDADRFSKPVTHKKVSKINLVDLAGSERLKKSGAQGQQLKEAAGINQSLSTLKKVIDALVTNSNEKNPKKHIIIPFRESTLTLLLSHSLGGNSKTTMIACVSPHYDNQEETLLTLRYAARTNTIVNKAVVNEDSAAKQALALKHQILELQRRLSENPVDEEAEALLDEIEVGKTALRDLETQKERVEAMAEEMRIKSKQEEGARYAAAFYNSLRMVMLQQQKDQLEEQATEIERRLADGSYEVQRLQEELQKAATQDRERVRAIEKMTFDERAKSTREQELEEYGSKLRREQNEAQRRLNREMELRYAQRLANAHRLRKVRLEHQAELEALQAEHDEVLTAFILREAEQYERQVRQFADADTAVQHRTERAERDIQRLVALREEAEEATGLVASDARRKEKAHLERMDQIEVDWKQKHEQMKSELEAQITELEEKHYSDARKWDEKLDEEIVTASRDEIFLVEEFEAKSLERESFWSTEVAKTYELEAEKMEAEISHFTEQQSVMLTSKRREYERRITELVLHYRRLESINADCEATLTYLDRCVAPLTMLFDDVNRPDPLRPSDDLLSFRALLRQYEGHYASNSIAAALKQQQQQRHVDPSHRGERNGSGQPAASVSGGSTGGSSLALPAVSFYPLQVTASPPGANRKSTTPQRRSVTPRAGSRTVSAKVATTPPNSYSRRH